MMATAGPIQADPARARTLVAICSINAPASNVLLTWNASNKIAKMDNVKIISIPSRMLNAVKMPTILQTNAPTLLARPIASARAAIARTITWETSICSDAAQTLKTAA